MNLARTLDVTASFVTLLERRFQIRMQRRTYDQAMSLGTIQEIALDRERVPSLWLFFDLGYDMEVAWIEEEPAARGAEGFWPSHLCVAQAEATRGTLTDKKR